MPTEQQGTRSANDWSDMLPTSVLAHQIQPTGVGDIFNHSGTQLLDASGGDSCGLHLADKSRAARNWCATGRLLSALVTYDH